MTTVADAVDAVVGGDTHLNTISLHLCAASGAVIAETTLDNTPDGHDQAVTWVLRHLPGERYLIGLEGTRSYGKALTAAFSAAGMPVVEIEPPKRGERTRRGKSDPGDARLAALKLLGLDAAKVPVPRCDGAREALRILVRARDDIKTASTRAVNRLLALLLGGDARDNQLRRAGSLTNQDLQGLLRRRGGKTDGEEQRIRLAEQQRLARTILQYRTQLTANEKQLRALVKAQVPELLEQPGVGPVSAAQLLVVYSHKGRVRNEAAFAALTGVSPVPASSGKIQRHRLNRGGDRTGNVALHTIAVNRMISHQQTRDYVERRKGELNRPEIRRVLKRSIARGLFRLIDRAHASAADTASAADPTASDPTKINNAA